MEDFSKCGLQTKLQPNKLPDPSCFQFLENAVIDQDGSLLRRNGYQTYNATASTGTQSLRGLWAFTDANGSAYLIAQTSASMVASLGNGSFTAINGLNGGLSTTAQMSCVQCLGALYCTDGTDPVFSIGVALATAAVAQAPQGKYIGCFRNRVLISGVSGTQTDLYLSGQVNGQDWTLPTTVTLSTSPAIINVAGINDGFAVKCLMGEFQNTYLIGRDYDLYGLTGNDLRDFTLRKVDGQIGCMDNNSPEVVNNALMWLSHRGVELLAGPQIQWASQPIDPTLKVIINAAGNSQSFTINSGNFTSGQLGPSGPQSLISATIFPGNLVPSSYTLSDDWGGFLTGVFSTGTNTGAGLAANLSTAGVTLDGISPQWLTQYVATVILESASPSWTKTNTSGSMTDTVSNGTNTIVASDGNFAHFFTQPFNNPVGSNFVFSSSVNIDGINAGTVRWGIVTAIGNGFNGPVIKMVKKNGLPGNNNVGYPSGPGSGGEVDESVTGWNTFTTVISTQGSWYFYRNGIFKSSSTSNSSIPSSAFVQISMEDTGPFYLQNFYYSNLVSSPTTTQNLGWVSTGTYFSPMFDTGLATPTAGPFTVNLSSPPGTTIAFSMRSAPAVTGPWNTWTAVSTGTKPSNLTSEFWQYMSSMTTTISTTTPQIKSVFLAAETTAYYITPCVTVSTPTSWGSLTVNAVTNGGSFSFWTATGATCAIATSSNAAWVAQTPNSVITAASLNTNNLGVRVLFSLDVATEVPTLNNLVVNWNAGASRPNVASAQYQNKYYLFYTTSQAVGATNDHAVVFDQNGRWQLMDALPASSAALYLNALYLGDSNATGTAYLYDTGNSGNGAAYNFSFTTPDLDGGDPLALKNWDRAYLLLGAPNTVTAGTALACTYTLDGSTETFSLGSVALAEAPTQSGYFVAKLPVPVGQPNAAHWVNLSCTNTGTNGPIRVYGYRLVYAPQGWP